MHVRRTAIVFLAPVAAVVLGILVAGVPGAIAGAILSGAVGGFLTWRSEREVRDLQHWVAEEEDERRMRLLRNMSIRANDF